MQGSKQLHFKKGQASWLEFSAFWHASWENGDSEPSWASQTWASGPLNLVTSARCAAARVSVQLGDHVKGEREQVVCLVYSCISDLGWFSQKATLVRKPLSEPAFTQMCSLEREAQSVL